MHKTVLTLFLGLVACAQSSPAPGVTPGIAGELNAVHLQSKAPVSAIALDMPDMAMRPERYKVIKTGATTYEAGNVRFSMAGTWRVTMLDAHSRAIGSFEVNAK